MKFYALEKAENINDNYKKAFEIGANKLLLIQNNGQLYLIENRCGHFGIPLETGKLEDGTIVCSQHSISFSLTTGEIVNRPYENADPIKIHAIIFKNDDIGVML